jgi:hypothetical protein
MGPPADVRGRWMRHRRQRFGVENVLNYPLLSAGAVTRWLLGQKALTQLPTPSALDALTRQRHRQLQPATPRTTFRVKYGGWLAGVLRTLGLTAPARWDRLHVVRQWRARSALSALAGDPAVPSIPPPVGGDLLAMRSQRNRNRHRIP